MERAKIDRLPKEIRAQLDAKIITQGFSGYVGLAKWLTEQGYEIKKTAVHEHGQKLQHWLESIKRTSETARAMIADSPDDTNIVGDALLRMVTDRLFTLFYDLDIDQAKLAPDKLAKVAKSIADLTRAQVNQKKFAEEMRAKVKAGVAKASEAVATAEREGGIPPEASKRILDALLGIEP
jgi:hypothetical protein